MNQWAATAKVNLPADIDFSKYKTCRIDFTASDLSFEFHGILGHKVNGAEVTDPQYGTVSKGMFQITLNNVLKENGTDPFVVINAGKAGYMGKVKILRVALLPEGVTVPDITIEPIAPAETPKPSEPETPGAETPGAETPGADTSDVGTEDVTKREETRLVLEGEALGESANFAYKANGAAQYQSVGVFEIDKTSLTKDSTITLTYEAKEGDTDVADSQKFNVGLKTGDKWNSPAVCDEYGKAGGKIEISMDSTKMEKINAGEKLYMHVSTATAGFKGTFTYTSVKAGTESLVKELPSAYTYVERGMSQWAPTAKVLLPKDIDFSKYSTCRIEFTASDPTFEFHGIVGHKVDGKEVTDPKYVVNEEGVFVVNLARVKEAAGTDPYVVINAGKAGYNGSVTITKIIFEK